MGFSHGSLPGLEIEPRTSHSMILTDQVVGQVSWLKWGPFAINGPACPLSFLKSVRSGSQPSGCDSCRRLASHDPCIGDELGGGVEEKIW